MSMMPVGHVLTNAYQKVLDGSKFHTVTEFINSGTATAMIIFGGQSLDDQHAIEIPENTSYYTQYPIETPVYAKGAGKLVVVADNNTDN